MKVLLKGTKCKYCNKKFTVGDMIFFVENHPYCGTYCATRYLGQKLQQIQEFEQHEMERN